MVKNPPANTGDIRDLGLAPRWGRSPGEGNGNPLQHSCLDNPMDGGAWRAPVHRVAKSRTRMSTYIVVTNTRYQQFIININTEMLVQSLDQEGPLEEGMATHFSIPAWRIPWTEEPGGLQSMGLHRVRHD